MSVVVQVLNEAEAAALKSHLAQLAAGVDMYLEQWLERPEHAVSRPLAACVRYSVFAGGKRLRPALLSGCYGVCGGREPSQALWAGAALEMIHTYSLMQDDLPCMDNDDLRRGKPTAHRRFNEATALLASDALQTGAYELLADMRVHPDARVRLELVRLFAHASGARGMVAGQMTDMEWEWQPPQTMSAETLADMNRLKTGMVISAACEAGAVLAGEGEESPARAAVVAYGAALGRAYQVYDDVLDVVGSAAQLGKTPGKDARDGKTTFVSLLGLEGARARANDEVASALDALAAFGPEADTLRLLARYCVSRTS